MLSKPNYTTKNVKVGITSLQIFSYMCRQDMHSSKEDCTANNDYALSCPKVGVVRLAISTANSVASIIWYSSDIPITVCLWPILADTGN